jgi:catechol-2,3-dioxygenase
MTDTARPRVRKLGHLVLKVRDLEASTRFYTEVLGLSISDRIGDRMVFMRAGTDHHDLALAQLPPGSLDAQPEASPGLEHFSYLVDSYADMEAMVGLLRERGVPIVRGPGKHGPGANCFLVFKDPDGNNVEVYCEMVQIDAAHPYEPRTWGDDIDSLDQWRFSRWAVEPPAALRKKYGL